ncbi:MAG TPA: sulfatase-like hydrolase/transferase, partial [Chitinophagaceae bacterium]
MSYGERMNRAFGLYVTGCLIGALCFLTCSALQAQRKSSPKPNVIIILSDDVGYGDVSCYGGVSINTPNIDRLATRGLRFTNGHASASTCTPSRYSILTGQYAWRKRGTDILPGSASLIIPTDRATLGTLFQQAGYHTAAIGKWHLGLGSAAGPDWNGLIKPGPNEVGFDYSFLIPATPDRVPCVYVENHHVVNLDPKDPISVSYQHPVGSLPTGREAPDRLKMKTSPGQGHLGTIINGISRIGWMSGGRSAWWTDSTISDVMTGKTI